MLLKCLQYVSIIFSFCLIPTLLAIQPPVPQEAPAIIETDTPNSSIRFAVGDISTLPIYHQPYIRYLSLYNIPKDKRREVARLVSFTINSLSRRRKIYIPVFVGASKGTVIRINLKDYEIDPKEWDKLGKNGSGPKPFTEPYFHNFVLKVEQGTVDHKVIRERKVPTGQYAYDQYGKLVPQYRVEKYEEIVKTTTDENIKRVKELQPALWLDPTAIGALQKGTQSEFPIFRADWFIVYSTVEPAYHKILGLGESEKDFNKVVFADDELAKKAKSQDKAIVIKSLVARNNRTLNRSPTFTKNGYKWISHDTLKSINDRNYVQNILDEKFDATEIIATLPNGLQAYFVADGKGKRLDKADNEVATDYLSADKIVRNGRSCIYCHSPGINAIQDEVRTLNKKLQSREQISLLIENEKDAYRIEELFGSNLDRQIVRDQQIYADAIGEATGETPVSIATSYFELWEGYSEKLLTKEIMAQELSITVQELDVYARKSNDPLFLGLVSNPIRPVRRDQFERSYQDFMVLIMRAKVKEKPGTAPTIILDPHELEGKKRK